MATTKGRSTGSRSGSKRTATTKRAGSQRKSGSAAKNNSGRGKQSQPDMTPEIILFAIVLVLLVITLCTFGVVGNEIGERIRRFVLGLFGTVGYILPPLLMLTVIFGGQLPNTLRFRIPAVSLIVIAGMLCAYFGGHDLLKTAADMEEGQGKVFYEAAKGGGIFFGFPALWLFRLLNGRVLPILLLILVAIFCILTMFRLSFFGTIAALAERIGDTAEEIRNVPSRYAPDEERLAAKKERRSARMREYEDERELREQHREEIQQRREEAERRRQEQLLAEDERRAEAARARQEREEAAKAAFEEKKARREEERRQRKEAEERAEDERILNASRPQSSKPAVPVQPNYVRKALNETPHTSPDEMHEITLPRLAGAVKEGAEAVAVSLAAEIVASPAAAEAAGSVAQAESSDPFPEVKTEEGITEEPFREAESADAETPVDEHPETTDVTETKSDNVLLEEMPKPVTERSHDVRTAGSAADTADPVKENVSAASTQERNAVAAGKTEKPKRPAAKYERPPISLLKKNEKKRTADSDKYLQEKALQLVDTLQSFGVTAKVIGISQGPSVTRFELDPAPGTKVNKIVGLADDLKLGLAAQDIRIEAPIPGKSAVGIEIPNKETSAVLIRDLIESDEFKHAESKISYTVGKDISGQVIVSDIAKMPHLLVAGATGSGKSVFINTLIMSILYEADPEEVKLIMVDPKFVELSVYNGIPHLLLPVVTDPRQANAALAWAVGEMTRRYRLFENNKVRGLPAYNEMVDAGSAQPQAEGEEVKRLPQIVVIVDELADLMMVASKEVEESICRLAQLARAAGIHLVIATQRPSVNVITGLIKANMPSRVAFKVSSGIDSRTILDMQGAERLLGYGDMLFAPQNLNKPLRVQGAFVSDSEVTKVVDFLKKNAGEEVYDEEIVSTISKLAQGEDAESAEKPARGGSSGSYDSMFDEVARYVVEKEKASSTMLQRVFKISYNRAVRIIDQLEENGVIGAEAGTKPRNVLMNMAQLEEFLQNKGE